MSGHRWFNAFIGTGDYSGMPRYIVTHLGGEKMLQSDGGKQEDCGTHTRGFLRQQLQRTAPAAAAVLAGDVVPELVGVHFGKEVGPVIEALGIEELPLDRAVDGLDIGVGVGTVRWVELVARAPLLLDGPDEAVGAHVDGVAVKLGAQIGADFHFPQIDTVRGQVGQEAVGGQCGVGLGQRLAVGEELGADAAFADGGLEERQTEPLHLRPVDRQIGEVFGVHTEAGEGRVRGLDRTQIALGLVAAFWFSRQPVGAQDATDSVVAERQVELGDQAARPEARRFLPQRDDLVFEWGLGFVGTGMRGAAVGL